MNKRLLNPAYFKKPKTAIHTLVWVAVLIPSVLKILLLASLVFIGSANAQQNKASALIQKISPYLNNGSAMLVDQQGRELFAYNADKAMVPASILKIATADAVLSQLGEDYRIATEFYLSSNNYLLVKGYGDPSLVSESLTDIAVHLKPLLKNIKIKGIWLDTSFFKSSQKVPGQSSSNNPYDASIGALVVNFNTIYVHKSRNGQLSSAESQTPLTATARRLAKRIPYGDQRINLGNNEEQNLNYFAELLSRKLLEQGIAIGSPLSIVHASDLEVTKYEIPEGRHKLYTHYSKPLSEIVQQLLYFSNNFTANQLLLILGAKQYGAPADLQKGRQALQYFLSENIALQDFSLVEGSGLSRSNQFTARQFIKILQHFEPYYYLLRDYDEIFLAKTGTLKGIATFAGYMLSPEHKKFPFVIMLQQPKRRNYRYKAAQILYNNLFQ